MFISRNGRGVVRLEMAYVNIIVFLIFEGFHII